MTTSYLYFSDSRIWLIVCSVNLEMSRTDSYARLSCDLVGLKKCYFQQFNRKCDKNAKTLFTTKFVFWVKFFFAESICQWNWKLRNNNQIQSQTTSKGWILDSQCLGLGYLKRVGRCYLWLFTKDAPPKKK